MIKKYQNLKRLHRFHKTDRKGMNPSRMKANSSTLSKLHRYVGNVLSKVCMKKVLNEKVLLAYYKKNFSLPEILTYAICFW